jgi:hypothetical protein
MSRVAVASGCTRSTLMVCFFACFGFILALFSVGLLSQPFCARLLVSSSFSVFLDIIFLKRSLSVAFLFDSSKDLLYDSFNSLKFWLYDCIKRLNPASVPLPNFPSGVLLKFISLSVPIKFLSNDF